MLTNELRAELREYLSQFDEADRKLMLRQLLYERADLREVLGVEEPQRKTHRGKAGGKQRALHEAGYVGNGENMRQESRGGGGVQAPWLAWNGKTKRMEPVTMTLTEATRRFPEAYGAGWLYPDVC